MWGATIKVLTINNSIIISIHAPVWGATLKKCIETEIKKISIHAPVWGATSISFSLYAPPSNFNSRSRVGSDQSIVNIVFE